MGHDISVKYNNKTICEVRIPAFDLVTSYAFYESIGALDYHNGVSGSHEEMPLDRARIFGSVVYLGDIKHRYCLQEFHERIEHTKQREIVTEYEAVAMKKIEEVLKGKKPDEKTFGDCGTTLEEKLTFCVGSIMRITRAMTDNEVADNCEGLTVIFA